MKGLYLKRGWYYWQPPPPKGKGKRPRAIALKTQDIVEATTKAVELSEKVTLANLLSKHSFQDTVTRYIHWALWPQRSSFFGPTSKSSHP